jgi:hypothetical protein
MNIYISGPMTGLPDHNLPLFKAVTNFFRKDGHKVFNPGEHEKPDGDWKEYMRRDINLIMSDDIECLALLPNWNLSRGAKCEVAVASAFKKDIYLVLENTIAKGKQQEYTLQKIDMTEKNWAEQLDPNNKTLIGVMEEKNLDLNKDNLLENTEEVSIDMNPNLPEDSKEFLEQGTNALREADKLVHGNRQKDYGHPLDNFEDIAKFWSVIFKTDVSAEDVALAMVSVKISRQLNHPKHDNIVDGCGYFATLEMILEERERRKNQKVNSTNKFRRQ